MSQHRIPGSILGSCLALGLVIVATSGSGVLAQSKVSSKAGTATVDLSALVTAVKTLDRFEADATALRAQAKVSKADLDELRAQAETISRLKPAIEKAIDDVTGRLKLNGKWTPETDAEVLRVVRQSGQADVVAALLEFGGARALLEMGARRAPGLDREVSDVVSDLQPRALLSSLIEPLFGTPAEAVTFSQVIKVVYYTAKVIVAVCDATKLCT